MSLERKRLIPPVTYGLVRRRNRLVVVHISTFVVATVVAAAVWGFAGLVIALSLSGALGMPTWSLIAREPIKVADWLLALPEAVAAIVGVYFGGAVGGALAFGAAWMVVALAKRHMRNSHAI
jgi:hypothetical protein